MVCFDLTDTKTKVPSSTQRKVKEETADEKRRLGRKGRRESSEGK